MFPTLINQVLPDYRLLDKTSNTNDLPFFTQVPYETHFYFLSQTRLNTNV